MEKILHEAGLGDRVRSRVHTCSEKKLMYAHKCKISKGLCTNTLLYDKTMHISLRFKRHWKWNSHLQFHKSQQDWNVFVHSCLRWRNNSKHCDLRTYRGVTYYIYPYGFCKSRTMQRRQWSIIYWTVNTCWVTFLNKKVSKESWERKSLHEGRDALLLKPVAGNKLHSDEPARSTINSSWKEQEAADTA
jgi:hypothetical protein